MVRATLPKVLHQHNVGFGEFILHVHNGLTIMRYAQAPAWFSFQCPDGKGLASREFKEVNRYGGESSEVQKVNSSGTDFPIGPAFTLDIGQHFAFLTPWQWHSPYTAMFVFAVIKKVAVGRFDRRDPAVLRKPDWGTTLKGYSPNLEGLRTALGGEIKPLAIARPAWREVISARDSFEKARSATWDFDKVDLAAFGGMKLECQVTTIWRPSWASRRSMQGSDLTAIHSISIAYPNIPKTEAIRLEGNLPSVGRKFRAHLTAFLRN